MVGSYSHASTLAGITLLQGNMCAVSTSPGPRLLQGVGRAAVAVRTLETGAVATIVSLKS